MRTIVPTTAPSTAAKAIRSAGGFFALRHIPGTITPNTVASVISLITVLTGCFLFGPRLGIVSLLGAMTALWEAGRPLWARVRNTLLIATIMTGSMALGVLVAPYRWAVVPVSVLIIVAVAIGYHALLLTRGPTPLMLFYAAVLGTFFGINPRVGWQVVGITAFACFFAAALTMLLLVFGPHRPERQAVAQARHAVAAYELSSDEPTQFLRRNAAYGAVTRAWLTLRSAWPATRSTQHKALEQELLQINRSLAASTLRGLGMDATVRPVTPHTPLLLGRPSWHFLLSHAFRSGSVPWFTAWRMGLAAGIAGALSQLLGLGHPYWAILTSTVVLAQWMDRVATTRRAAHRSVGTIVGLAIVWAVSQLDPSPWWVVAIVLVCMVGQNLLLPLNYAVGLMLVTPMALLSIEATGTGGTSASLIDDRLLNTLLGVATAVVITWATSRVFPRRLTRAQSQRAATAVETLEHINREAEPFSAEGRHARTELHYELVHHLSVLDRAIGDDPRLREWAATERQLTERGYAALGVAWQAGSVRRRPRDEELPMSRPRTPGSAMTTTVSP